MLIEEDFCKQVRKFIFPLEVSRNIWLTDDKLILEYPLRFNDLRNIGEAVVFSLLPIAYCEGSNIELPKKLTIEEGAQERINNICCIWNKWFYRNRKVKIFASKINPASSPYRKRYEAQLFSGGVDSLTTFKRNRERINYLLLYKGADVPITRPKLFEKIKDYIEEFAREYDKELIVLSSNIHYLGSASWEYVAHGCALLGPILALSNYINKIYIPATHSGECGKRIRLGSHPYTDPLVRVDGVEVIHDGFELKSPEKLAFLSKEPELLKRLRVCGNMAFLDKNVDKIKEGYNCGCCEKCYYTLMILLILRISPDILPFPKGSLSLFDICEFLQSYNFKSIPNQEEGWKIEWAEGLEFLERNITSSDIKGAEELRAILKDILGNFYYKYKNNFPKGITIEYIDRWRKLERRLHLKLDSLQWLKEFIRWFRGRRYRNFVKKYGYLTKVR